MANLFYDHLIIFEEIEAEVQDKKALRLIDEVLQHEILDVIFTYLPRERHEEFLAKFMAAPGDPSLIGYLKEHAPVNVELAILDRVNKTKKRLLREVKKHDRKA